MLQSVLPLVSEKNSVVSWNFIKFVEFSHSFSLANILQISLKFEQILVIRIFYPFLSFFFFIFMHIFLYSVRSSDKNFCSDKIIANSWIKMKFPFHFFNIYFCFFFGRLLSCKLPKCKFLIIFDTCYNNICYISVLYIIYYYCRKSPVLLSVLFFILFQ